MTSNQRRAIVPSSPAWPRIQVSIAGSRSTPPGKRRSCVLARVVRSAIVALDPADPDHPVRVPELTPLDLGDLVLGIPGPGVDGFEVLPVDRRHARTVGIARAFDAEEA